MALNTRDEKAVQHKPKSLPNTGSHPARPDPNPNSPSATVRSTYQHHKPFGPFSQSPAATTRTLSLIHISEPTRQYATSRMPSSA